MKRTAGIGQWKLIGGAAVLATLLAMTCSVQAQSAVQPGAPAQGGVSSGQKPTASAAAAIAGTPVAKNAAAPNGIAASAQTGREEEAAAPGKPGGEGIKMHGHWVLQVKNADGTLGERREFDNSLVAGTGHSTTSGDQLLGGLLSGSISPGGLAVAFIKGPVTTSGLDTSTFCNPGVPSQTIAPSGISCYPYFPAGSVWTNGGMFNFDISSQQSGLSQTVNFSPTVSIVLAGNYTVPSGLTEVDAVQTYVGYCYYGNTSVGGTTYRLTGTSQPFSLATYSPVSCAGTPAVGNVYIGFGALSSTNVPSPLAGLASGQVITVTVTISFS